MDKNREKLYIKLIQQEMNNTLKTGQLTPEQQYDYINSVCLRLIPLDEVPIDFIGYFEDMEKLDKEFKKQYKDYITHRGDMAKDMYEEIKKL